MSKGSMIRQMKRRIMRESGVTWAERVKEAVRTGQPVKQVVFKREGKKVVAETK